MLIIQRAVTSVGNTKMSLVSTAFSFALLIFPTEHALLSGETPLDERTDSAVVMTRDRRWGPQMFSKRTGSGHKGTSDLF